MTVPKLNVDLNDQQAVQKALDGLEAQKIEICNWPEVKPYRPEVQFRIFHTGENMVIRYEVIEKSTAAAASEDDGKVWEDSCVEFFISPGCNMSYYNFEANCIGKMHIAHRNKGEKSVHATPEQFALVKRFPSIGTKPFPEIKGENQWSLTLIVPAKALFEDNIESWDGLEPTMNFYKCGDKLSDSHYLSWAPINIEKPSFHRPDFFRKIKFEK